MRWASLAVITLLLLSLRPAPVPGSPAGCATVEPLGVAHALPDRQFTVTGTVRNAGPLAVSRLVIDVRGYGPQGDLAAFGSDGIPWTLAPGESAAFRAVLPLGWTLIRSYHLAVTGSRPPLGEVRRVGFGGAVVRVLAVEVTEVDFEAAWSGLLPGAAPDA